MSSDLFVKDILVLHAKEYDFVNKEGEVIRGVTMHYTYGMDFSPVAKQAGQNERLREMGVSVMKSTVKFEKRELFEAVPGVYECGFGSRINVGGKQELYPEDIRFKGLVELSVLLEDD